VRRSLSYPTECATLQRKRMPQYGTVSRLRPEVLGPRSTSDCFRRYVDLVGFRLATGADLLNMIIFGVAPGADRLNHIAVLLETLRCGSCLTR